MNRKLLCGAHLGVEVAVGFGQLSHSQFHNYVSSVSKEVCIPPPPRMRRNKEVMKLDHQEGGLISSFDIQLKQVGAAIAAENVCRNAWPLTSWSGDSEKKKGSASLIEPCAQNCFSFSSRALGIHGRGFPNRLPGSLPPGDVLAPVVVTTAFPFCRKALLPLHALCSPWGMQERQSSISPVMPRSSASDLPSNLGNTLLSPKLTFLFLL